MMRLLRRIRPLFTSDKRSSRDDRRNGARTHGVILQTIESDIAILDQMLWSPLGPIRY